MTKVILLEADFNHVNCEIEKKLDFFLKLDSYPSIALAEAMRYSALSGDGQGGKRFRPFLIYFIGKRLGIDEDVLFHIGACLEMIHTYTLIHDDLPSMDDDDMRRGKPSNHKKFGEAIAILSGDSLQGEAFYWLSSDCYNIASDVKIKLINLVAEYCGGRNVISGQVLDINFTKSADLAENIEHIYLINTLKTAKMIELCCAIVATLGDLSSELTLKLNSYGLKLGAIFQLVDDIEDFEEDEISMAKILGLKETYNFLSEIDKESKILISDLEDSLNLNLKDLEIVNNYILSRLENV